ncbi:MAG: ATP-binding protein [Erysipelotrichaceae bacterium]|nr:ATP-binding protein [Erysipelotrichaceae bacterium]
MRFIGRKEELKNLENAYSKNCFQMCVLYGRRRIGKTTLIKEFCKNKEFIYFTAVKGSISRNIELFSEVVVNHFLPGVAGVKFNDLKDIISFVSNNIKDKKLVFVIDELPYLAQADESFLSLLQVEIDSKWQDSKMFLILSGSSVSFMEQEILSSKSPIYGRRTMQIDLKPFNYLEAAEFVKDYSLEEKAITYGVTGGIAKYLEMFDENISLDENLINLYFTSSGFLYEEPHNLLVQEFKNAPVYDDVIYAVAGGANRANEIKDKTKMESTSVHNVLDNLMKTRIIEKDYCITDEKNNKKVRYNLKDGMFLFWYKFIPRGIPAIEVGNGEQYYYSQVKPFLHEYMGEIFEKMAHNYVLMNAFNSNMPFVVSEVGKWNGSNPKKKEQTDIDVVGINQTLKKALIGECKFKNSPIDKGIVEQLLDRNGLIDNKYTIERYFLFSLNGFSEWVKENAEELRLTLITLEEMYK